MKKQLPSIFVLSALLAVSLSVPLKASLLPVTENGVEWLTNYNPDVRVDPNLYDKRPDDISNTTLGAVNRYFGGGGTGSATIVDDYLRTITTVGNKLEYNTSHGYNVSAGNGLTVEARFRVAEMTGTHFAAGFVLGAGLALGSENGLYAAIPFSTTAVGAVTGLDLTEWTTVRFTITNAGTETPTLSIYINNNPDASYVGAITDSTTASSTYNRIRFGDFHTASDLKMDGTVDWDYVRWTSEGAFAPIPEPSIALLPLGAALIGAYGIIKRRHGQ